MPLDAAAEKAKVAPDDLGRWEDHSEPIELEDLRRLAKTYNRNWYVFLLEDEVGNPALPRDFRRVRGARAKLSPTTLLAFDDADFLLQKISDLPRPTDEPRRFDVSIAALDPDEAADRVRTELHVDLQTQMNNSRQYDSIRFWTKQVAKTGIYAAQLSFPYREVRAFCRERDDIRLIVVSSQDSPRGRSFSMLHELAHLLLGGDAMCKPSPEEVTSKPTNEEAFCNAFAAAMLMPEDVFKNDPEALAFRGKTVELGDAETLAWKYGASELAGLRRLATLGYISQENYARLQAEKEEAYEGREEKPTTGLRIRKQATRMVNENSRLFAGEVLDAHARGDITFRDIGVLLDGNLKHYGKVHEELSK